MRLIDADALESKVLKWMPPDPYGVEEKEYPFETDICASLMMEIQQAPTIEPMEGEWIIKIDANNNTYGRCSICGMKQYAGQLNFCPNCGARMK